jgi:hypothetical protein
MYILDEIENPFYRVIDTYIKEIVKALKSTIGIEKIEKMPEITVLKYNPIEIEQKI